MGVYFLRGDNICIIGEIDAAIEKDIDYSQVKVAPIKSAMLH